MAWLLLSAMWQAPACPEPSRRADVVAAVSRFDLAAAVSALEEVDAATCPDLVVGRLYLRGLVEAQAAYRQVGVAEALSPLRRTIEALDALSGGAPGSAQVASAVLRAAAAAAQLERDELRLLLDHARQLEVLQRAAGEPGAPFITAHEMAGELWLQIHAYEDARRAFALAAERVGRTPRVVQGLARAAGGER